MKRVAFLAALAASATGCIDDEYEDEDSLVTIESEASLPLFHGRFGSPSIVRDGDRLHAYFAKQAYQNETVHVAHARSDDGGKTWLRVGDALPQLNQLAVPNGSVWAPGAARIDDDHWMLYYTAVRAGTGLGSDSAALGAWGRLCARLEQLPPVPATVKGES